MPLDESFERRDEARARCRLGCTLLVAGRRHEALVRDVSPSALRVHTEADLRCGAEVIVSLETAARERFVLAASVREKRAVARSLAAACTDAFVLALRNPPPSWHRFVNT